MAQHGRKLMDQVRDRIRTKHYSKSTEKTYVHWILHYIRFHGKKHPSLLREREIEAFLSHLAQGRHLSASSQNQAFCAVVFLYREVLRIKLDDTIVAVRAKRRERIPSVLTADEARAVISVMEGVPRLMASVLYGSGLRLNECLSLRVKHIDLRAGRVMILDGKGKKDRFSVLPASIRPALSDHLLKVKALHLRDLNDGHGSVVLPFALNRKYKNASKEFRWQFVFPQKNLFHNKETGERGRWHAMPVSLQKAVREAGNAVGIMKRVTPHIFRHSFATHLLENGYNIRTVQELLGHRNVKTTMLYTHVMAKSDLDVVSPLDKW